jgi:hypothetical protein
MKTMQEIIQDHIIDEMFSEFPTDLSTNAFDFFLKADVECTEFVSESSLGTEWGYEVCEAYELENIHAIRALMQSMYSDLERLKSALFQQTSHNIQINKDEIVSENAFYDIAQYPNAILHRQGTNDEFVTFITISEESVS